MLSSDNCCEFNVRYPASSVSKQDRTSVVLSTLPSIVFASKIDGTPYEGLYGK